MFHLVDFKGGRQRTVVPDTWLSINDTLCLLPSKVSDQDLEVLARNRVEPGEGWQIFGVNSLETFESYAEAKKKLERSKETVQADPPRKRKKPGYLSDYNVVDYGVDEPSFTVFRTVDHEEVDSEDEWEPQPAPPPRQFIPRVNRMPPSRRIIPTHGTKRGATPFTKTRVALRRGNEEVACACKSSCHGTILQALRSMQKQLNRTNQMVEQLLMERPRTTPLQPKRPLFRQPYNHVNGQDDSQALAQDDADSIQSLIQIQDTSTIQGRAENTNSFTAADDGIPLGEFRPSITSEADLRKNIDVRGWLMSYPKGRALIQKLDSEIFFPKDRQLLVRLVCKKLIELCGNAYPSTFMKEHLAKEIVKTFPFLKSSRGAGHEAFYDTKTSGGFISYRLKTIRLTLPYEEKRHNVSAHGQKATTPPKLTGEAGEIIVKDELLSPSELEENVAWMAEQDPDEENKIVILSKLKETMKNRQKEIKETDMSVAEIFTRYPRLKDYKGEMIYFEFGQLYSNGEKFLQTFETYFTPRIISYVTMQKPQLLTNVCKCCGPNDNLKSLLLLPELLPIPNYKRVARNQTPRGPRPLSKKIPNPDLIVFVDSDENLMEAGSDGEDQSLQPYLICVNSPKESGGTKKFYIRVDEILIEGPDDPMKAFDVLFKLHFVFNIQYAKSLENFYNFMSSIVYEIDEPRSSTDAFYTVLRNIPVFVEEN